MHGVEPVVQKNSNGSEIWYTAVATAYKQGEACGGLASEDMDDREAAKDAALSLASDLSRTYNLPPLPLREVYGYHQLFQEAAK